MKPLHQRLITIVGVFLIVGGAALFIGITFKNNIRFFVTPSQFIEENLIHTKNIKIGGVVKEGSVSHKELTHTFILTDGKTDLNVTYQGILPDLFREGQTIVVEGALGANSTALFHATTLLAKHDENYRPPLLTQEKS